MAPSEKFLHELRAYMEEEDSIRKRLRRPFDRQDFLLEVSCWAWEYCMKFPLEPPSRWEHPLEFTALHAEYRELFEGRAYEFCKQERPVTPSRDVAAALMVLKPVQNAGFS